MKFEFEQQAYDNAPLPKHLSQADTMMFLSLRALYQQYKSGGISKEQAQIEKRQIEKLHSQAVFLWKLVEDAGTLRNRIGWASGQLSEAIKEGGDCTEEAKALYWSMYQYVPEWMEGNLKYDGKE